MVDGCDFAQVDTDRIRNIKDLAREQGLSVWYSCAVPSAGESYDKRNIPLLIQPYLDLIDVVIVLEPKPDHIALTVSKDRSTYNPEQMALRLDPKTLLILED
jgi:hypothetical protein